MTRDDLSTTTGATNSTTFIGVIDVVDSAARRASMMKKSIAKSARTLKEEIRHEIKHVPNRLKHIKSERNATGECGDENSSTDSDKGESSHPSEGRVHINPYDSEEEEDCFRSAKGLGDKFAALPYTTSPGSSNEGGGSKCGSKASKNKQSFKDGESKSKRTLLWSAKSPKDHSSVIESPEQQHLDVLARAQRKERVKTKLEKYKTERSTLKSNCATLEAQLLETAEKLREIDSKAAYKIDSLEVELQKTKEGMEHLVNHSTKEVTDQSACIKTLGKKLIRQAHVIKQQKKAVGEYQIQLEALREEMAMQDERDSSRDEEYNDLKEDFERTLQQKVAMQDSLQESIEEMMDLRREREMAQARMRELELNLEEKSIDLERAKRENVELNDRITNLETTLQDKNDEVEVATSKLIASEQSVDVFKSQLAVSAAEIDDLREKSDALSVSQHSRRKDNAFKGWIRGQSANIMEGDETTLEEKLEAKVSCICYTVIPYVGWY